VKHKKINWNPYSEEWFCIVCGRTSIRPKEEDARAEMEMYECQLPAQIIPEGT
jgi:hypothetical protein